MIRPGTSVNKTTNISKLGNIGLKAQKKKQDIPKYSDFNSKNDWVGAIAMLDIEKSIAQND